MASEPRTVRCCDGQRYCGQLLWGSLSANAAGVDAVGEQVEQHPWAPGAVRRQSQAIVQPVVPPMFSIR